MMLVVWASAENADKRTTRKGVPTRRALNIAIIGLFLEQETPRRRVTANSNGHAGIRDVRRETSSCIIQRCSFWDRRLGVQGNFPIVRSPVDFRMMSPKMVRNVLCCRVPPLKHPSVLSALLPQNCGLGPVHASHMSISEWYTAAGWQR